MLPDATELHRMSFILTVRRPRHGVEFYFSNRKRKEKRKPIHPSIYRSLILNAKDDEEYASKKEGKKERTRKINKTKKKR